jgi:hypothetical protein
MRSIGFDVNPPQRHGYDWDVECLRCNRKWSQSTVNHVNCFYCDGCVGAYKQYSAYIPGRLYYVRFDLPKMSLWKIGITNRTVEQRFRGFRVRPVVIRQYWWHDGSIAQRIERKVKHDPDYQQYKYRGPKVLENGNTECFTIDIMSLGKYTRVARSAA